MVSRSRERADEYAAGVLAPLVEQVVEGLDALAKDGKYPAGRVAFVKEQLRDQVHNWFGLELSSQLVGEGQNQELNMAGLNSLLKEVSTETAWMVDQNRPEYAGVPKMRRAISEISARISHDALLAAVINPTLRELG